MGEIGSLARRSLALLAAAVAVGVWSPAVRAQARSREPPAATTAAAADAPAFIESIDVDVVNVDVHVTGKDGRPVQGLTAADFEITEDGRPVVITNFYVVEDGLRSDRPAAAGLGAAGERAEPAATSRAEAEPARAEDRLHLVVYVDNFNLRPLERNRVLDEVATFLLRTLRRGDRVMLASYDTGFEVRHPFTEDPFAISRELDQLREVSGHLTQRDNLRREAIKDIDRASSIAGALSSVRIHADMVFNELGFMFDGLKELVDHLAGLPGRKAVLHVSSGIPMIVGEELFYAIERKFDDSTAMSYAPRYDLSRRFDEVGRRANANRVSFYMLDAGGLRPHGAGVDEQGLRTPGLASSLASDYEANHHSPLRYLAAETGGQAIVNQNAIAPALARVRDTLRTFYSLGFTPSGAGDESYHRIGVKVPGRNVLVEHRTGYQHKSIDTRMRESTLAALYHFYETNPLGLELILQETIERETSSFLVALRLEVPVARVTLLPVSGAREARLRLYLAVMDDQARVSDVSRFPIGFRLAEEHVASALTQRFVHTQKIVTRGGRQKIAIGLRDEISGEMTFLARSLLVGRDG